MNIFRHFITITRHRHKVMALCFKVGLYAQGFAHDLSKYTPSEFIPGAKYYQGSRSPQARERELFGYSRAGTGITSITGWIRVRTIILCS